MEEKLKVRFAPSPTGFLHIGSARTALFNWIFAKKNNAEYVLRIEDTDVNRSKKEFLDEILDSLSWLGIKWDNISYQSEDLEKYHKYAQKLVEGGFAYKEGEAVIFKYSFEKIEFCDLIRGNIEFKELPKDTEVLIKSDGTPTYNFACCIDDAMLEITHVIRGEDHIPNTPKQILIYQALGFKVPKFAHLPMILSSEGGKLSKRFGATAIGEYRQDGYLAESLINYLLLLGWSPKDDRQIISFDEATDIFELGKVNKSNAAFALEKLDWMNGEYIRKMDALELTEKIKTYLVETKSTLDISDEEYFKKVVVLLRERISKLSEFEQKASFCFSDNVEYSDDGKKVLESNLSKEITTLKNRMESLSDFGKDRIEKEFRSTLDDLEIKMKILVHPVRVALSGEKNGPGLFETMEVLGKERLVKRLEKLMEYWKDF